MENNDILVSHNTKIHEFFLIFHKYEKEKTLKRGYFVTDELKRVLKYMGRKLGLPPPTERYGYF